MVFYHIPQHCFRRVRILSVDCYTIFHISSFYTFLLLISCSQMVGYVFSLCVLFTFECTLNISVCVCLRWKNWWVRGILTLAMISFFFFIIYLGPMVLMMIVSTNNTDEKLGHLLVMFSYRTTELRFFWLLQSSETKMGTNRKINLQ